MYQVEFDRSYGNLLEDALTRLAARMGIDEGEESECDDMAIKKGVVESLSRKDSDLTYYDTNSGY